MVFNTDCFFRLVSFAFSTFSMVCFNSDAAASSESRSQASAVDGWKGAKVNVHVMKWIQGSVGVERKERERKLFIFIGALRVEWSSGWNDYGPV
jgi:hypothetical protein